MSSKILFRKSFTKLFKLSKSENEIEHSKSTSRKIMSVQFTLFYIMDLYILKNKL